MKQFWQMMLSFVIQEVIPVAIMGILPSALCWVFNRTLGTVAFVVETGAALLEIVSFVVIGRFLRRQWTETAPYVYKSGFSLLARRSYLAIEETDGLAFSQLLKAVRHRETMTPLRPLLLINDISKNILLVSILLVAAPLVIALLVMTAFSQLIGKTFKAHKAHG